MGPDWLGSPQHFAAGATIAAAVVMLVRPRAGSPLVVVLLAVGISTTAESIWEIAEYGLRYAGHFKATAYWDTVADLAATLVGAISGAVAAWTVRRRKSPM